MVSEAGKAFLHKWLTVSVSTSIGPVDLSISIGLGGLWVKVWGFDLDVTWKTCGRSHQHLWLRLPGLGELQMGDPLGGTAWFPWSEVERERPAYQEDTD